MFTDQSVLNSDAASAFSHPSIICLLPVSFIQFVFVYNGNEALLPCESEIRTKMDRNQPTAISNRESIRSLIAIKMPLVYNILVFERCRKPHKYVLSRAKFSCSRILRLPDSKFKKRKKNLSSFVYVLL